jgi:probable phosphoglycerate mutase
MFPIYLIRHGETALNANRTFQPPATPLSERGLDQARRLGARLASLGIAGILASDLARAAMTAEALKSATRAPLEFDAELHERNFGDLRGRPYESLGFDAYALGYTPPNGESWEMFHARVERAWPRILAVAARTPGPLAVVTHGLVCRAILSFHAPPAPGCAQATGFRNTSLSILEGTPWRATLIDCVAHLDDVRETAAT